MGKRKTSAPRRVNDEKRQFMTWNMIDGATSSGSLSVVSDDDPKLLQEWENSTLSEVGQKDHTLDKLSNKETDCCKGVAGTSDILNLNDTFNTYLEKCVYCITIVDRLRTKPEEWSCEIGRFDICLISDSHCVAVPQSGLPQCSQCWLYVADGDDKSMLYFELQKEIECVKGVKEKCGDPVSSVFWCVEVHLPLPCLDGLQLKSFQVIQGAYNISARTLELIIYGRESILSQQKFSSEPVRIKKMNIALQELMKHFYGFTPTFCYEGLTSTKKHDIEHLYAQVMERQLCQEVCADVDVQHPSLKPLLRQYQRQSVWWMLHQERYRPAEENKNLGLHPLYEEVTMKDGKTLYYNKHSGSIVLNQPLARDWHPGGILADEMGLGKTVEVLCCMMLHRRQRVPQPERLPTLQEEERFDNEELEKDDNRPASVSGDFSLEDGCSEILQNNTTAVNDSLVTPLNDPGISKPCTDNSSKPQTYNSGKTVLDQNMELTEEQTISSSNIQTETAEWVLSKHITPKLVNSTENNKELGLVNSIGNDKEIGLVNYIRNDEELGLVIYAGNDNLENHKVTRKVVSPLEFVNSEDKKVIPEEVIDHIGYVYSEDKVVITETCPDKFTQIKNRNVMQNVSDLCECVEAPQEMNHETEQSLSSVQDLQCNITTCVILDTESTDNSDWLNQQKPCRLIPCGDQTDDAASSPATTSCETLHTAQSRSLEELPTLQPRLSQQLDDAERDVSVKHTEPGCGDNSLVTPRYHPESTGFHQITKDCGMSSVNESKTSIINLSGDDSSQTVGASFPKHESVKLDVLGTVENFKFGQTDSNDSTSNSESSFICNPGAFDFVKASTSVSYSSGSTVFDVNSNDTSGSPLCVSELVSESSVCDNGDLSKDKPCNHLSDTVRNDSLYCQSGCDILHVEDKLNSICDKTVDGQSELENCGGSDDNKDNTLKVWSDCSVTKHSSGATTTCKLQNITENVENKSNEVAKISKTIDKHSDTDDKSSEMENMDQPNKYSRSDTKSCDDENVSNSRNSSFSDSPVSLQSFLECICGSRRGKDKDLIKVQCVTCSLWQHAKCVKYDLDNPYRGQYKCPHCHVISSPIPSGATLIISPASISHQWEEEIAKHIRKESLSVFVYTGVNKLGYIQPQTLASYDIVITMYETLRREMDYVDLPHSNSETGRRFRHPKRFMAIPSPIISVEWWRICLDEAQMVECTSTKTAEMALRLTAVNKWCVTGTPIQKSVEDLYGLILFLGMDPYWVHQWWKKLLYEPFCYGISSPMYEALSRVLWRTAKKDVLDQINLPSQTEQVHWLTFSPVEDHFYRRQFQECTKISVQNLSKWTDSSTRLSSLDRHTMSQLLNPLLKLRQACCHPQAVRGEFLPLHKSTLTMEELLESLIKKVRVECEEAHRQLVAALNGLAAIHIIKEEHVDAVEKYRDVLRSVEEHRKQIRTDDLQQLHAMHNLHELLTTRPAGVDPTLRDDQLQQQAQDLREKYMLKVGSKVQAAIENLLPAQTNVQELQTEFSDGSDWWNDMLDWVKSHHLEDVMIEKIREDLSETHEVNSLIYGFRDLRGLEYVLYSQLAALEASHRKLSTHVLQVSAEPSPHTVSQTVECCLRPDADILKTCPFCQVDELFNEYESKLFSFVERGLLSVADGDDTHYQVHTRRQGTWADSELERVIKTIYNFARIHRLPAQYKEMVEFGNTHIKLFDALKKEFKQLRTVWLAAREQVSSLDELDMATTRLRVRLDDEPVPETPQPHVLERGQVDLQRMKLVGEKATGSSDLRKRLGQLFYLENLAKTQQDAEGDGLNPEPCPICQRELGAEWSVLQCGHCFCLVCIRIMVDNFSVGGRRRAIKCALCRNSTHYGEISYVSTKNNQHTHSDVSVKGSHSTKVEAVVKCLLEMHNTDPEAKALVFSTWQDVLGIIEQALTENSISCVSLHTPGKFQKHLTSFRESDITVLLLPIHSGSNGLNLIEATHVLLVEPILNPAQELQAIGRVHRIGQTRPTTVHRFLVRGTIEERINMMVKSMSSEVHDSGEVALTIGQLSSLFQEVPDDDQGEDGAGSPS